MAEVKKKLRKKTKIRESYREFVRKIIFEARESIDNEESANVKKLKSLKSSLQEKKKKKKKKSATVVISQGKYRRALLIWKQP